MSTLTKVFIVLTSLVAIVLSCLTVTTAARWSNMSDTLDFYVQASEANQVRANHIATIMATNMAIKDDELAVKSRLLAAKADELRQKDSELARLRIDLAQKTNEAVAFEAGRKKLEEILDVQTAELTSTQKQNQTLRTQNIDLQTRNQRLASRNLELTSLLTISTDENRNLQEKLYAAEQRSKNLEQGLASGRRPISDGQTPAGAVALSAPVAGPIAGEVVDVNGGYVSISVGQTSGVVMGMPFMVYRGQSYVGDLEVETVRPKTAGGKLTLVSAGQQVRPGDRVVYGLE